MVFSERAELKEFLGRGEFWSHELCGDWYVSENPKASPVHLIDEGGLDRQDLEWILDEPACVGALVVKEFLTPELEGWLSEAGFEPREAEAILFDCGVFSEEVPDPDDVDPELYIWPGIEDELIGLHSMVGEVPWGMLDYDEQAWEIEERAKSQTDDGTKMDCYFSSVEHPKPEGVPAVLWLRPQE